jgi:hypothetical protein
MDLSAIARRLPEEFLAAPGLPVQRVELLVYRYWPTAAPAQRDELSGALLSVLQPLLKSSRGDVPNQIRDECERVVKEWSPR